MMFPIGNGPLGPAWLPTPPENQFVWRRTKRVPLANAPPTYYCVAFFPQSVSASVRQGVTVNTLRPGPSGIGDGT